MNIHKIESILIRIIAKKYPFIKYGGFGLDKDGDPTFNLYVDTKEVVNMFDVKIDDWARSNYKKFDFLHGMFEEINDRDPNRDKWNKFITYSMELDDLIDSLIDPLADEYMKATGNKRNQFDADILIQYYMIK